MTNQDPFGISKFFTPEKNSRKKNVISVGSSVGGLSAAFGALKGASIGGPKGAVGGAVASGVKGGALGAGVGALLPAKPKKKSMGMIHKDAFGVETISKGMHACPKCGNRHMGRGGADDDGDGSLSKSVLLPKPFKGLKPLKPKTLKPSKPGANHKTDNTSAGGTV